MNTVENTTETKLAAECACNPCRCADCACGSVTVSASKGCDCAPCGCGDACACDA